MRTLPSLTSDDELYGAMNDDFSGPTRLDLCGLFYLMSMIVMVTGRNVYTQIQAFRGER